MFSKITHILLFMGLCLIVCLNQVLLAQSDEVELGSLQKKFQNSNEAEVKARAGVALSEYLVAIDPQLSLKYAQKAFESIQKNTQSPIFLKAQIQLEKLKLFTKGPSKDTPKLLAQLQEKAQIKEDIESFVETFNIRAQLELKRSRVDAYEHIAQAIRLGEEYHLPLALAKANELFGAWLLQNNPKEAISQLKRAADIYRQENEHEKRVFILQKIADIQANVQEDYLAALNTLQTGIKISDLLKNYRLLSDNLNRVAYLHLAYQKEYKQALQFYYQAYIMAQEYDFLRNGEILSEALKGVGKSYASLANQALNGGEIKKAQEYERLFYKFNSLNERLDQSNGNVAEFKDLQKNENRRQYGMANPKLNSPGPGAGNRLREIEEENRNLESLAKSNKISILEEVSKKADLGLEKDSLRGALSSKSSEIDFLKKESETREKQIEVLSRKNAFKNQEILEARNWFKIWLGVLGALTLILLGTALFFQHQKNQEINGLSKKLEASRARINRQEVILREQETFIERKEEELVSTFVRLDDAKIDNRLIAEMLEKEVIPHLHTSPPMSEKVDSTNPWLIQETQFARFLLHSIYQVQHEPTQLKLSPRDFKLQEVLEQVWESCDQLFAQKNLRFKNLIPADVSLWGDPVYYQDLFLGLLYNTYHYAPANTSAYLAIQEFKEEGEKGLELTYQDEGARIPVDVEHAIFDKFAPKEARPLALSLPYIQRIVHSHGGSLYLDSQEEKPFNVNFRMVQAGPQS